MHANFARFSRNQLLITVSLLLTPILVGLTDAHAETATAKKIAATLRLIPLKKMTVGPDDQYHGTPDPSGNYLAFTRKSDLVPHLCSQVIQTGEVLDLLAVNADSDEPAINPRGELAFTFYKYHAGGDICHRPFSGDGKSEAELFCLNILDGEPSSPFWKTNQELGYVLKDSVKRTNQIVVESLDKKLRQVLAQGIVWSPTMKVDGRYLFYNQMTDLKSDQQRVLMMKDLQTDSTQVLRFALPGISGFPAVSEDEKYLYFSHYLNDTNNDNVIDGNDNSVIFRVPIASLLSGGEVFPEQLTSVENNCSFPRPYRNVVYATCAFEGALDIYQLPTTGVVPTQWDEATLNNAHQTSRSYSERILILNTLKYRFPSRYNTSLTEERILSNHLMGDDIASSQYYLQQLRSKAAPQPAKFYDLLSLYLQARKAKKIQNSREISLSFAEEIGRIDKKIDSVNDYPRFKKILKGLTQTFLNHPEKSAALLKSVSIGATAQSLGQGLGNDARPIERYLYFELANWTLPRLKTGTGPRAVDGLPVTTALNPVYFQMMSARELPAESRIYYAFQFLQKLQADQIPKVERSRQIQQEIQMFGSAQKNPSPANASVLSLLESEQLSLKLILATDKKAKLEAYHELDKIMSASRDNYFLRKAVNIRAILNFAEAGEFNYLTFIATNWLRYTQTSDTEFAHARKVFAYANLDQAYDSLGAKKVELADNYFFASLTLTDDLESHYGYIKAMIALNQRANLTQTYTNLKEHQQVEDNIKFVDALLTLIDGSSAPGNEVGYLDKALALLKSMEQDRDSALRYLMMGYCDLEKLLRLSSGYEVNQDLFESAHRNLMLAYDQGMDNDRIKASALMDLGILHQRVQNHGLATKFFGKRKPLGFTDASEEALFSWYYARSLYFINQPDRAAIELDTVDWSGANGKTIPASYRGPILERKAFYLEAAGKFADAAKTYEQVFQTHQLQGNLNLAKVYLNYGSALFKLKKIEPARQALMQTLDYAKDLPILPKSRDRAIAFEPVRIKAVAYGLLAQLGSREQRLEALAKRKGFLLDSKSLLTDWLPTIILNDLQTAFLLNTESPGKAAIKMEEALKRTEEMGASNQYLSNAVYRATVDYLVHAIRYPDIYASDPQIHSPGRIKNLVEKIIETYDKQKTVQPVLEYQKIKIQMLWATYQLKVLHHGEARELDALLNTAAFAQLKTTLNPQWNELRQLRKKL